MDELINIRDSFIKNIFILISGSVVAQFAMVLLAPIMTRLFTVEDIGIYTYITTIAYVFAPVINGRYELAIVSEQKEKNVYALIKLSFYVMVILIFVITVGYVLFFYTKEEMNSIGILVSVPFLLFMTGILNILTAFNNRKKEFSVLSKANSVRAIGQLVFISFLGILKLGEFGLLFGHIFSQIVFIREQGKTIWFEIDKIWLVSNKMLKKTMLRYYKLPLFSVPAAFFNNISYAAISFFIENLFGVVYLGYYSLSFRILGMPLTLISQNIATVFFEEASREYNVTGRFNKAFNKTFKYLFAMAVPITAIIYFSAPWGCSFFLGEKWRVAGEYIQIMSIMFGVRFIASPLTIGIVILNKSQWEVGLQFCFLIASIGSFCVCKYYTLGIEIFLLLIAILYSAIYILFTIVVYYFATFDKK